MEFGVTFEKDALVTFNLDPDSEVVRVVRSGYYRTQVVTMDGIDISYATVDLSYAQIPAAI